MLRQAQPGNGLLEACELILYPGAKLRKFDGVIALHHRHRSMTKFTVLAGNNKNLLNLRVRHDDTLHLLRLDTFAAAEKQIIQSSQNSQTAVAQYAFITGGKPALIIEQRQ